MNVESVPRNWRMIIPRNRFAVLNNPADYKGYGNISFSQFALQTPDMFAQTLRIRQTNQAKMDEEQNAWELFLQGQAEKTTPENAELPAETQEPSQEQEEPTYVILPSMVDADEAELVK